MTHLTERFGLDLPNPLTGDLELAADFLEGAGIAILEAEALLEDLALPLGKGVEDFDDLVLEHGEASLLHGVLGGLIFDEVAEGSVVGVTHGGLKRDGLLGHFEDGADTLERAGGSPRRSRQGSVRDHIPERAASARA